MPQLSDDQREQFRTDGYLVVPDVLTGEQVTHGRQIVAAMLEREPPQGVGVHFLWPRFDGGETAVHPLLQFYRDSGITELADQLLHADLAVQEPDFAQVATTIPPWPHRPGSPHIDGVTPLLDDGTPGTFTMLAGLWLTSQHEPDRGNLYVWPGTHRDLGAHLAEHGADALSNVEEMNPGPYPNIPLGDPVQATGPAGSVLFAHYLLAHNIGGHFGPADDERRETLYYRLQATGHRARWREAVTTPLLEFRQ